MQYDLLKFDMCNHCCPFFCLKITYAQISVALSIKVYYFGLNQKIFLQINYFKKWRMQNTEPTKW